jgi:dolichyl-phosphate beta-glucosyltransferase
MAIALSLVIPAYNEAQRLPAYLGSIREHFDRCYAGRYEVIVVDVGSRDGLQELLAAATADWPELALMEHSANRGKGAAVRTGVLAAHGELLLFADADGATPINQEGELCNAIRAGADVAVGSRLVPGADVIRRRTWVRKLTGRWFAGFARRWLGISVRDTQCGFKMFRREVGRRLFSCTTESGYLFDLELLMLAERMGYRIAEVPINWSDVPGGHLSISSELGRILTGLWRLKRRPIAGQ